MLDIPAYVLRYWESEFPELNPQKTATGQRIYSETDIETVKMIAHLRYHEKLTLPGTKRKLRGQKMAVEPTALSSEVKKSLRDIKNGLQEILAELR